MFTPHNWNALLCNREWLYECMLFVWLEILICWSQAPKRLNKINCLKCWDAFRFALSFQSVRRQWHKQQYIEAKGTMEGKMRQNASKHTHTACACFQNLYQLCWNQQKHRNWMLFVSILSFTCLCSKQTHCQWYISIGTFYTLVGSPLLFSSLFFGDGGGLIWYCFSCLLR